MYLTSVLYTEIIGFGFFFFLLFHSLENNNNNKYVRNYILYERAGTAKPT